MVHNNYGPFAFSFNYLESKFLLCIVKLPLALTSCTSSTVICQNIFHCYKHLVN